MKTFEGPPTLAAALLQITRYKADLGQEELAEAAGVPPEVIVEYETGVGEPPLSELIRIIQAVDLDLRTRIVPSEEAEMAARAEQLKKLLEDSAPNADA